MPVSRYKQVDRIQPFDYVDLPPQTLTDSYVTYALHDLREIDELSIWLKNVGSNILKFRIQVAYVNKPAGSLVDGDFIEFYVADNTQLAGGVVANGGLAYYVLPKTRGWSAVRVQAANNTGGQANSLELHTKAYV